MQSHGRILLAVAVVAGFILSSPATVDAQSTIKNLDLREGTNHENQVISPIYETSMTASLYVGAIERAYDVDALVVQRGSDGNVWVGSGPDYCLNQNVNLAELLRETLTVQGEAFGFSMTSEEAGAWVLTGTLREMQLVSEQTAGATLFYGSAVVEIELGHPDGTSTSYDLTLYNYKSVHRGGFRKIGRAREAIVRMLVEFSHDILAHINMAAFSSPVFAELASASMSDADLNEIYRIGLTGSAEFVPRILDELPRRDEVIERMFLIEALARLGSTDAISPLAVRYEDEDEDCRWATLKAMAYIGGDAAIELVRTKGVQDEDLGTRRLAGRISESPGAATGAHRAGLASQAAPSSAMLRVTRASDVLDGPMSDSTSIGTVSPGEVFEMLDERGAWYLIRPPGSGTAHEWRTGWIEKAVVAGL